ncbi:MAG: TRAP transporter small permease [Actinobacteria bacterium]|nr:TRAP transporter small permease [Actinomycetota bacterium]
MTRTKLKKVGHGVGNALDFIGLRAGELSVLAVLAIFALVVIDVIGRYTLNHPVKGSTDIGELLLVPVAFCAMPYTQLMKEHVQVQLLLRKFSPRVQAVAEGFGYLGGAAMYGLIAWNLGERAWQLTMGTSELTSVSPILRIPHIPFVYIAALFSALFCLVFLADSVRCAAKLHNGTKS